MNRSNISQVMKSAILLGHYFSAKSFIRLNRVQWNRTIGCDHNMHAMGGWADARLM